MLFASIWKMQQGDFVAVCLLDTLDDGSLYNPPPLGWKIRGKIHFSVLLLLLLLWLYIVQCS